MWGYDEARRMAGALEVRHADPVAFRQRCQRASCAPPGGLSRRWRQQLLLLGCLLLGLASIAGAEDGYDLWLRYQPLEPVWVERYQAQASALVGKADSPTLQAARDELQRGLQGLLGKTPTQASAPQPGAIVYGTPTSSPLIAALKLDLSAVGTEGYVIRSVRLAGQPVTVIAAPQDIGVLYGSFHFLRLLQTQHQLADLNITEAPRAAHRMLNHWDNLDRSVERGYAGASLWDWHKLPDHIDTRYIDYARANASLGINATALTNVNANATALTEPYLRKAAALADVMRPYGIRVFLTARFSAPMEIGGLETADPLDPQVRRFWQRKTEEIYALIPDFGGYLVKANSEGQPGPQDYERSHADGANMLAEAVGERGLVIWRAFVYSNEQPEDRAKQAFNEFVPLDGTFRDNVMVQVKNGAVDFQPREPFHPLFGALPKTPIMMEFQITKEYLGFATHLVYLGTFYEEVLQADTQVQGAGSTVARVLDGSLHGYRHTGLAGVANTGTDRNWSGSHFDQANWYAFGRFAWNPQDSARRIAEEWVRLTFGNHPQLVQSVVQLMMESHQHVVDYMTPLGLHHLMGESHHYGPAPWVEGGPRADWTSVYFHRATKEGVGFDRSSRGSDAVGQYAPPVAKLFDDVEQIPESLLLWFHHVRWDHRLKSGRTVWDELVHRYTLGVQGVTRMRQQWDELAPLVDSARHAHVASFLRIQEQEARWWRDACIAYFQSFSGMPIPAGYEPPEHSLEHYRSLEFPHAPGI